MRRVMTLAILALLAGCQNAEIKKDEVILPTTQVASSSPSSQPASAPAGTEVMAYINGQPVYMADLNDLLVRSYGLKTAQQLIANELTRQEAAKRNITVSDEETQAEHKRTIDEIFGGIEGADQQQNALQRFLEGRNISQRQWDLINYRNALLRKMVEKDVTVSDAEIDDEFGQQYGRKVVVRDIQSASLEDAQEVLKKVKAEGADFAAIAREHSKSPTAINGGLLPPIGASKPDMPPAIRQAALAMKKPGELSEIIQISTAFHILKLEEIIQPENVKLEDVKEKISFELLQRKIRNERMVLLRKLFKQADVKFANPVLDSQVKKLEQMKENSGG